MADGVKFMQTLSVSTFMAEEPAGLREHEQITSVAESERMLNEARECRSAAERRLNKARECRSAAEQRLNEASGSRNEAARILYAFMKINPTDFTSASFVTLSELLASEQRNVDADRAVLTNAQINFDSAADRYERITALNDTRVGRNDAKRLLNEASGSRNEAKRILYAFMKINPTDFTSAGFVKLSELLASEQRYFDAAADRYERSTALNDARVGRNDAKRQLNEASGSRNDAKRMLDAFMKINPTDFASAGFVTLSEILASEQRYFDAAAAAVERHATLFAAAQTKYAYIHTSQNSGNFLAL